MSLSRSKINAALRSLLSKRTRSMTALSTIDRFQSGETVEGDDRGIILVSVALIEQELEELILTGCLKEFSKLPHRNRLFSGDSEVGGAVTTFAAKITLGHALGLYGDKAREDLDRLRRIRNVAAHSKTRLTFNTPAIRTALASFNMISPDSSLSSIRKSPRSKGPKGKFLAVCGMFMIYLHVQAKKNRRFRPRLTIKNKQVFFYS
jgi:hypothetical protein